MFVRNILVSIEKCALDDVAVRAILLTKSRLCRGVERQTDQEHHSNLLGIAATPRAPNCVAFLVIPRGRMDRDQKQWRRPRIVAHQTENVERECQIDQLIVVGLEQGTRGVPVSRRVREIG